ncbi:MAG TPA: aquaporin [Crenalkalicoccus sp.]|nr:aquaporin [Crenalkalicoccus sp.]
MALSPKSHLAEFIGTFALIFVGAGAATALGPTQVQAVAFAHGLTIMIFAFAFGEISGGHFNPAVTIGLGAAGAFPARNIPSYVVAQLLGAIVAGFCLLGIFGGPVNGLGATTFDLQRITEVGGFALEGVGTFFLVTVVLLTAVRKNAAGSLAPFAIGMTITICILFFGDLTGGSINPARTLGPDVARGMYDGVAVYIAAQLVGGIVAGVLYRLFWAAEPAPAAVHGTDLHGQAAE